LRESDIEIILQKHMHQHDSEIGETEGRGALNFLDLDDRVVSNEGQEVDPGSVYRFDSNLNLPILPQPGNEGFDEFLEVLKANDKKWRIVTDQEDSPKLLLEAESYLCDLFSGRSDLDVYHYCHRPIVVTEAEVTLDEVIEQLEVHPEHRNDYVVDNDVILYWNGDARRIITGADILGQLLKGIVQRKKADTLPS